MITLFQGARVYAPDSMGHADVLVGGSQILAVGPSLVQFSEPGVDVIDARGKVLVPGLIDSHVHITGGGGEGGPGSRMPELELSQMLEGGVTTVVGCLGTDGITRSVDSVLMKVKNLRAQGVSAWMYTGAYQVPPPSITGDFTRDIALIEEVIGLGEIAISDHRSSVPSIAELARLAAHARVAGMLGGKAGIVNLHLGDAPDPFRPIHDVVAASQLSYLQFLPTHVNRNPYIFEDAKSYGIRGYVDITTSSWPYFPDEEIKPSRALKLLLEAGVPIDHITFTSDACGSLPAFDPVSGKLLRIEMGLPSSVLREIREAILEEGIAPEVAFRTATSSPAQILRLEKKGRIEVGADADLLLMNEDFHIEKVMALGRFLSGYPHGE
ncbi:MAG TPA: beta-aspartyl-peptidase [Bacteroidales bacterium]|nr:beta-aspartyl-peptidase [Bacteroidales bacterium]